MTPPPIILVTGASGFLGQFVVSELLRRGHQVRALVRNRSKISRTDWPLGNLKIFEADLAHPSQLTPALAGIDTIIHLAAQMHGNGATQITQTTTATQNLLDAMQKSTPRHLVLASSMSVYDWSACGPTLSERSPLEQKPATRDAYAIAKLQQESLVTQAATQHAWTLAILRPAYIWGRGATYSPGVAAKIGPIRLVMAPRARLPLVYVENCADAFADAAELRLNLLANLIDDQPVTAARFVAQSSPAGIRIAVPYILGLSAATIASTLLRPLGLAQKLPGLLQPRRFRARFRPLNFETASTRAAFPWRPRYNFTQALQRATTPVAQPAPKLELVA